MSVPRAPIITMGSLRRFLAGFRRITTSGNYIPEIDGLRFVAIALVIMCHVGMHVAQLNDRGNDLSARIFTLGNRGVELFFVISGFVLATPFAAHYLCGGPRVELGRYFLRRLTRLEPPYLAALFIAFITVVTVMRYLPDEQLGHLRFGAFYLHGAAYGYSLPALVVAWSLEIEVQFYILMPLLAFVFLVRNAGLRRLILLAGMILPVFVQWINIPPFMEHPTTAMAWHQPRELGWWQHIGNYIQFFFAGILMADVYVVAWKSKPRPAWWGDIVWLIGWPALVYLLMLPKELLAPRLLFAPVVCVLYLSLFRSRISRWVMSWPLIATIGGMCYSMYLVHLPVIQLIAPSVEYVREGHSYFVQLLIVSGIMVPTILIACGLFYRLVERPCMRRDWPIRLWNALFVPAEPASKELSR